jgi:uncharacterized membrane protein YphA (DoxX/SURF4 family)
MIKRAFFGAQGQPAPKMSKALPIRVSQNGSNEQPLTEHDDHPYQARTAAWMARNGVLLTRIALGLVFLWFGVLKFVPGMSEAEDVAKRTLVTLTLGRIPSQLCLYVLAAWECAIGVGLLWGRFLRFTLVLLFLQLPGTFLPLLFFPSETWKRIPYAPTLEGQYIIKNLVLVSAGIIVGSTMRGGKIISDPTAARVGARMETFYSRLRSQFHRDPKVDRERH